MPLQDLIHKYEVGTGYKIITRLLAFVAIIAIAVIYDVNTFRNLTSAEGMENAQLARNIADGKGFTTDFIRPFSLHLLKQRQIDKATQLDSRTAVLTNTVNWSWPEPFPDVSTAPLYPILLAGALKIMPFEYPDLLAQKTFTWYTPDLWIIIFNQLLLLIAACLVFRLARLMFDEPVAWVSTILFATTELFWRSTYTGTSTMLLITLFLGAIMLLAKIDKAVRDKDTPPTTTKLLLWSAATGLLMGLGGMTRYAFLGVIVAVVLWMLFLPTPKRGTLILATLALFTLTVTPWLVRNYNLTGTPFGTASFAAVQGTTQFPHDQLERSLHPDFRTIYTSEYVQKFWNNAREIVQTDLPKFGGNWVSALFLVGLLVPFRNPTLSRLRILLLTTIAILFPIQALSRTWLTTDTPDVTTENLLLLTAPLAFIFGVGLLFILIESTPHVIKSLTLALFFLLTSAPLLLTFLIQHEMSYFPPWIQEKSIRVGETETMMTDIPWAIAWYGHRQSVWLTIKHRDHKETAKEDFYDFFQERAISALYLTSKSLKTIEIQSVAQWAQADIEDQDWRSFSTLATGLADQLKTSPNQEYFNKLKMLVELVQQHWIKGDDESWASFLLGIYVNREVPSGFPLKGAPLGLASEVFLKETERNPEKPIQSSK
jgi:4-amino-4-deoxy-L-arabinose transferase-like glycosyltransferase